MNCTYEMEDVLDALVEAIKPKLQEGDKIIRRGPFRWRNVDGDFLSNHYEMFSLESLAEDFGYKIIHNFKHVGVVRNK